MNDVDRGSFNRRFRSEEQKGDADGFIGEVAGVVSDINVGSSPLYPHASAIFGEWRESPNDYYNVYNENNILLNMFERTRRRKPGDEVTPSDYLRIVAPMVRYSKLPFRMLTRKYGADICHTPMVLAKEFHRSQQARNMAFETCREDFPLVVQFAACDPIDMGLAAEKCIGHVQGVDLNCGCPQRWAIQQGIGAAMIEKPQLIKEMIKETRKHVDFPISIKIRLRSNIRKTLDLIQMAEAAGVSWITVHGRTVHERNQPVHLDEMQAITQVAKVPIVFNGSINTPSDMVEMVRATNVNGVMSARGILANPALFADYAQMPWSCITDYLNYALEYGGLYPIHYQHIMFMTEGRIPKAERRELSLLSSMPALLEFFATKKCWQFGQEKEPARPCPPRIWERESEMKNTQKRRGELLLWQKERRLDSSDKIHNTGNTQDISHNAQDNSIQD